VNFTFLSKKKIARLSKAPGVYAFKDKGVILYIGKATNILERVKNHFQQPTFRDRLMLNQVKHIGFIKTDSEIEALILEANLIKKYQPKYNVVWRDDKNYFFVGITNEDFPRIFWTHQTKLKPKTYNLKPIYVGPFVDGKALKETLKILRKVFPYRSCRILPKRACLWYHLGRCPAPCLLKSALMKQIGRNQISTIQKESQKNVRNLMRILQGKKFQVLKNLKKEMREASKIQNFEKATKIRDQIWALERVISHAKIFNWLESTTSRIRRSPNSYVWKKTERELKKILKIGKKISRIEAYDVSNIQGQEATGSMVTFIKGLPDKNFYRRFKIKIAGKPNDIAMIEEVLSRRLKHLEWGLPNLILIDGGKAQLNASVKILNQHKSAKSAAISVISLAKKKNELFIEGKKEPILLKSLPREIFNLILQLRDEAHRFAITYHKKLRYKDLIPK